MPRSKKAAIQPIATFPFVHAGEPYIAEIWKNYPDEGKRGTHRRSIRARIFDLALDAIAEPYYFSGTASRKELVKRSLYNPRFNNELLQRIEAIYKAKGIRVARSTVYNVAADIKKSLKALDNAIAAQAKQTAG